MLDRFTRGPASLEQRKRCVRTRRNELFGRWHRRAHVLADLGRSPRPSPPFGKFLEFNSDFETRPCIRGPARPENSGHSAKKRFRENQHIET